MRLATSVCASFVLILPLAFGGDADGTAQKESRPYRYEFKRIPAPKVPDVSAIIAEDSAGRIYFAFPGKDGGLLRWDGKAIKDVVRGDVGGVATGPGGTCYYTLGQDLWMIGWPDADNRMVLPRVPGQGSGRKARLCRATRRPLARRLPRNPDARRHHARRAGVVQDNTYPCGYRSA